MKKFYLFLGALIAAFSVNAQTLGENLLAGQDPELLEFWWADNSWSQIANPDYSYADGVMTWNVTTAPGALQWQAQSKFRFPAVKTQTGDLYYFSLKVKSTATINAMTVKLMRAGDDGTFYTADTHKIVAGEDNVLEFKNLKGFDANGIDLIFDMAGIVAGATVEVSDLLFCTMEPEPLPEITWVDADSDLNMWKNCSKTWNNWTANDAWGEITPVDATFGDDNSINVVYPVKPGNGQWQAQVKIDTDIVLDAASSYDFKMVLNPTCNVNAATVKLTSTSDDGLYYIVDRVDLVANQPLEVIYPAQTGKQINDFRLCFDFAGIQANAPLTINNIIIQRAGETNAIQAVDTDCNAPAVYYNLQGVQVANPTCGLYIVKQGSKVSKMLVK